MIKVWSDWSLKKRGQKPNALVLFYPPPPNNNKIWQDLQYFCYLPCISGLGLLVFIILPAYSNHRKQKLGLPCQIGYHYDNKLETSVLSVLSSDDTDELMNYSQEPWSLPLVDIMNKCIYNLHVIYVLCNLYR